MLRLMVSAFSFHMAASPSLFNQSGFATLARVSHPLLPGAHGSRAPAFSNPPSNIQLLGLVCGSPGSRSQELASTLTV